LNLWHNTCTRYLFSPEDTTSFGPLSKYHGKATLTCTWYLAGGPQTLTY
jgi:hypothetical protein